MKYVVFCLHHLIACGLFAFSLCVRVCVFFCVFDKSTAVLVKYKHSSTSHNSAAKFRKSPKASVIAARIQDATSKAPSTQR